MRLRRWCWKMPNSRQLLKLRIMKGENFWSWWRTSYASHHPRWWTLQTLKDKTVQRVINLKQFCAQYDLYVERKKIFVQKCATLLIGSTGICNAHDLSVCGIYLNNLLPWLKYVGGNGPDRLKWISMGQNFYSFLPRPLLFPYVICLFWNRSRL